MSHRWLPLFAALAVSLPARGGEAKLAFRPDGPGRFAFDTGTLQGTLRADAQGMGLTKLVHAPSGTALAAERANMGLLSYYRSFSAGKRWGVYVCGWPKAAELSPDGAVGLHWPAADDHPFAIDAVYRWASATAVDLETVVTPTQEMRRFEIFLASYFEGRLESRVYVRPSRHGGGGPAFVAADVNPLVAGTYLSFPRDLAAAQVVLDGRWELGLHPVQWSVTRYLAAPMAMRRDAKTGLAALVMARPQDCFAIGTPYNMEPKPDGVAGHYSMYFSLFGVDIAAGESRRAVVRLVVDQGLSDAAAVKLYGEFVAGAK